MCILERYIAFLQETCEMARYNTEPVTPNLWPLDRLYGLR